MAATGKWQWMVAVERQSTTEGEDNGGGFRVRRLGQRGRRMCAPLQATRKRRDVDLGKGDDSPHWLSTLSSSLAPYAVAAAASSPPLSFPNADLVLRLHLDPCPTTTRISRLARITRRVAAGREDRRRQRGGRRGGGGEDGGGKGGDEVVAEWREGEGGDEARVGEEGDKEAKEGREKGDDGGEG